MTTRADEDLTGKSLADRYDVLELLGRGGMGAVYRARDRELDELVALKVIRGDLASVPDMVERFRHEVKLARRVTHLNVARTFELGYADGVMYCTMELIEGESLKSRLALRRVLSVGEAVAIACAVCDGLGAAHAAGVVHRDIKPENVLLASDGRVVMADFGVAAFGEAAGELSGTPAYMAPEQARGEPPTPATDVYAIGVVLYEMLAGKRAFVGDTAAVLRSKQELERIAAPPELGAELVDVIGRATARDVGERFASADALRRALGPWARVARTATHPSRGGADPHGLSTVVVLPPQGDESRIYIAEAIHERLLTKLARLPRVRVLPRAAPDDQEGAIVVHLHSDDVLAATICRWQGSSTQVRVPLDVRDLEASADAIVRVISTLIEAAAYDPQATSIEAYELMLRARSIAQRDFRRSGEAMELFQRARDLAPTDPRIAAGLAIARVRFAFFGGDVDATILHEAGLLAAAALVTGPDHVEAQLAAGHVELNVGDAAVAAGHFRRAIACAPLSAEAHEQLGKMLLEAGYREPALARLEEAIAINPHLRSARWEIARAFALEGKWDDHDRLVAELATDADRPVSRVRFAWWRRDRAVLEQARTAILRIQDMFVPRLMIALIDVHLSDGWTEHRDVLVARAHEPTPNRRRGAFVAQLIAEAAGAAGDVASAVELIRHAISHGLFDLHWLDRCVLLDGVRGAPEFPELRREIKARADAILDALYGDHHAALSETAVAPSAV